MMTPNRWFFLIAVLLIAQFKYANADFCKESTLFDKSQCKRITAVVAHWKSSDLDAIPVGPLRRTVSPQTEHNSEADGALALVRERENEIGLCRYDEEYERIEVASEAFQMSDVGLSVCLAAAFAQARYASIEEQWLAKLGEHEAWIVRNGRMTKMSVGKKIEPAAARHLWASFATRELVAELRSSDTGLAESEVSEEAGFNAQRAPASVVARGHADEDVRRLLGLE